jgi:hypothetical protein
MDETSEAGQQLGIEFADKIQLATAKWLTILVSNI